MKENYQELEKQALALSFRQKAALARTLIEDLDSTEDGQIEDLWIEEAQRRYEAYLTGNLEAVPGQEAMQRARQHLK